MRQEDYDEEGSTLKAEAAAPTTTGEGEEEHPRSSCLMCIAFSCGTQVVYAAFTVKANRRTIPISVILSFSSPFCLLKDRGQIKVVTGSLRTGR